MKKRPGLLRHLAASIAFCLACGAPLAAQDDITDVIDARVVSGWTDAHGARFAAIELRLAPGWKTYWRHPGAGGIAPAFDWSGSDNVAGAEIRWPHPQVFDDFGLRTIGYAGRVVLPVEITARTPGAPVRLSAQAAIGVCRDVCLPVELSLAATLPAGAMAPPADRRAVTRALATAMPDRAGPGRATCAVAPIDDGLRLEARFAALPPIGPVQAVFVTAGRQDVWVSEPALSRDGDGVVATADLVPPEARPFALDRSAMRFTLLGERGVTDVAGCAAR